MNACFYIFWQKKNVQAVLKTPYLVVEIKLYRFWIKNTILLVFQVDFQRGEGSREGKNESEY